MNVAAAATVSTATAIAAGSLAACSGAAPGGIGRHVAC